VREAFTLSVDIGEKDLSLEKLKMERLRDYNNQLTYALIVQVRLENKSSLILPSQGNSPYIRSDRNEHTNSTPNLLPKWNYCIYHCLYSYTAIFCPGLFTFSEIFLINLSELLI